MGIVYDYNGRFLTFYSIANYEDCPSEAPVKILTSRYNLEGSSTSGDVADMYVYLPWSMSKCKNEFLKIKNWTWKKLIKNDFIYHKNI